MATSTVLTNKPINPRGNDNRPVDSYNRASLYSGKALDFDGVNDEITPSGSYFVNPQSGTWTFCAYIYAENSGVVFSRDNQYVELRLNAGKLVARVYAGGWQILTLSNVDLLNEWNFVCWKYDVDNSTFTGYVNGVEQLTETLAPDSVLNFDRIASTGGSNFFGGKIGGVKIYNVGLTAAQVADLYNNPEKVVPTGVSNTALKLWLPMMEGAGTTAYDGSGNGNHGTISGATYVNGVGAPVAQSAVIDWNKGTNFFSSSDWSVASATTNGTISSSTHLSPNGVDTAAVFDDGTGSTYKRGYKVSNNAMTIGQITASTFVKKKDVDYINVVLGTEGGTYKFYALVNLVNGTIVNTDGGPTATSIKSVGNGWYYVSVEAPHSNISQGLTYIYGQNPANTSSVDINYTGASRETYIWGINIQEGPINNVHLPTIGALQTSPVLLPQGLTTGRDITGVNLFENVRKQGALNLDGNSWVEVHDNASLDFGTGSLTLEAWVRAKYENTGSSYNVILNLGGNTGASSSIVTGSGAIYFFYGAAATGYSSINDGSWTHIVGTYDAANTKIYINGIQENIAGRTPINLTNALVKEIGRDNTTTRTYKDQIAQPRIYNRALTASEVLNNYNATKAQYQ